MLGPMIAACGGFVPMVSGRGLGHTGGTLDKLEAIPRLSIFLDDDAFRAQIKHIGVAIMGQTHSLAPADKRIYRHPRYYRYGGFDSAYHRLDSGDETGGRA